MHVILGDRRRFEADLDFTPIRSHKLTKMSISLIHIIIQDDNQGGDSRLNFHI